MLALSLVLGLEAATPLPSFNAQLNQTTVSGLSSGGYMAVQVHVAYSSIIAGAAIFAGGPYYCAKGSESTALTTCMNALPLGPDVAVLVADTNKFYNNGEIDNPANLANKPVYMFSGTQDTTVKPAVMNALQKYYEKFNVKINYANTLHAAHTQPTDDSINKNACTTSATPYISNCNFDGAGAALKTILGNNLNPRNDGTLTGEFVEFDQTEFIPEAKSHSISQTGWAYVPKACKNGDRCKIHISFHGCLQNVESVGMAYVKQTGLNKWADTNNIVVVYPQTIKSPLVGNPNGCWDWWGYIKGEAATYTTQKGTQMKGIRAMLARLTKSS